MKKMFTEQSIIGEVVTIFPKASDLFKAYRIDFCCGGNRPLGEALKERNLDTEEILQQLNQLYEQSSDKVDKDWSQASYSELVDHIVQKHHRYLAEELPQLSPYVTKVMRVHEAEHPHLLQVHTLFNQLKTELEQHTMKEENEVFPLIIQFENHPTIENYEKIKQIVEELMKEHDAAGDIIKEIRKVTSDFTLPEGACRTYQLVYNRLEALESDLFEHIHLENNILFPRILSDTSVRA
jgi:regulator of cell morphogenesis and NO signaling